MNETLKSALQKQMLILNISNENRKDAKMNEFLSSKNRLQKLFFEAFARKVSKESSDWDFMQMFIFHWQQKMNLPHYPIFSFQNLEKKSGK